MKTIRIDKIGAITIRKSKRAKRIILKIDGAGKPYVTIPAFTPYIVGEQFARSHQEWLSDNMPVVTATDISEGQHIGRSHTVTFQATDKTTPYSRISNEVIRVYIPDHLKPGDSSVQTEAQKASTRALRKQAEAILPKRLHALASEYGYTYSEVRIKAVKTRWGSCSSGRIINLSIWLMQLPDDLIDYVICHELTHLNHMHHKTEFWSELAQMVPDYKLKRQALKAFRPALM